MQRRLQGPKYRYPIHVQVWADIGYLGDVQHTACTVKLPHCVQQVECDVRANGKRLIHLFNPSISLNY